ncbi:hypothetical protein BH09PLA1_BH09PLA1_11420 [soil metagenome]
MKSRTRIWALATAVVGALGLASASMAALPAVIGNFETAALDAWGTDGGPGAPVLSQGTLGVTLGSSSLKSVNPQGSFWGPATGNLVGSNRLDLQNAQRLSVDITMLSAEINGGSGSFDGFAQSNEMVITLFGTGAGPGGSDLNLFIQKSFGNLAGAGVSDSKGHAAQWAGDDGTRTLVWDLTKFTANDPNTGTDKSVAQFLAAYPAITDGKIAFVEQFGGGSATVGPGAFYFDNVVLRAVPEPATLGFLAVAAPMLAMRRRRSN